LDWCEIEQIIRLAIGHICLALSLSLYHSQSLSLSLALSVLLSTDINFDLIVVLALEENDAISFHLRLS